MTGCAILSTLRKRAAQLLVAVGVGWLLLSHSRAPDRWPRARRSQRLLTAATRGAPSSLVTASAAARQ